MEKKELKRYAVIAVLVIAVFYIIQNLSFFTSIIGIGLRALQPLFIGCIIAYIFNIILNWFEKHYFPKRNTGFAEYSRRPVCITLSFILVVAVIYLVLKIIIPEIITAIELITSEIPPLFIKGRDQILLMLNEYPEIQEQVEELLNEFDIKSLDWESIIERVMSIVQTGAVGIISSALGIISSVTSVVTTIVLAVIFAIYLLLRKDKLLHDTRRSQRVFFSERLNTRLNHVLETAHDTFQSFFIGQFVEAIIIGSLTFIGMTLLKLPYAAMTGTVIGVTALIPIVGAFLGAGIGAFIILTVSPMQALIFLIFLVILQQFETNIIYPRVVGSSIGLPGIWVLAAVTLGGGLFGILGMLLGVPLVATLYKLYFEKLEQRERELGISQPEEKAQEKPEKKQKPGRSGSLKKTKSSSAAAKKTAAKQTVSKKPERK
ncbi:MAG: AI-2E family transporter [Ruminococcus sp.]|nr:AI-2E family transporter [Ruminococcus sp.]